MLNIDKLDKKKTYIGYQIGKGAIARAIQIKSKMLVDCDIDMQQIASHVYALVFESGDWHVYESHLAHDGVKDLLFSEWLEETKFIDGFSRKITVLKEDLAKNFVFPYELDLGILKLYAKFNPGYSLGAIGKIATSIHSLSKDDKDKAGMICSEYIALAMKDHKACYKFDVAPSNTIPLHIQLLDKKKG